MTDILALLDSSRLLFFIFIPKKVENLCLHRAPSGEGYKLDNVSKGNSTFEHTQYSESTLHTQ